VVVTVLSTFVVRIFLFSFLVHDNLSLFWTTHDVVGHFGRFTFFIQSTFVVFKFDYHNCNKSVIVCVGVQHGVCFIFIDCVQKILLHCLFLP
jgi:hypothetical protein